jgi:hypothetical protein
MPVPAGVTSPHPTSPNPPNNDIAAIEQNATHALTRIAMIIGRRPEDHEDQAHS